MTVHLNPTQVGQAIIGALIVIGYVFNHLGFKVGKQKVQEVHVLVNDQMDTALARIADLEQALNIKAGEPVPGPPSPDTA